jgi:hypothetical protein
MSAAEPGTHRSVTETQIRCADMSALMQVVQWMICGGEVHQLEIKQALPPVIGERSRTLILGSSG